MVAVDESGRITGPNLQSQLQSLEVGLVINNVGRYEDFPKFYHEMT